MFKKVIFLDGMLISAGVVFAETVVNPCHKILGDEMLNLLND